MTFRFESGKCAPLLTYWTNVWPSSLWLASQSAGPGFGIGSNSVSSVQNTISLFCHAVLSHSVTHCQYEMKCKHIVRVLLDVNVIQTTVASLNCDDAFDRYFYLKYLVIWHRDNTCAMQVARKHSIMSWLPYLLYKCRSITNSHCKLCQLKNLTQQQKQPDITCMVSAIRDVDE